MSSSLENLALRKQMLATQAAVQRLRIAQQVDALREDLRPGRIVRGVASSPRARATLFTLLLVVAGRGRLARWVRGAALAMSVAGLAASLLKRTAATSGADAPRLPPPSQPL